MAIREATLPESVVMSNVGRDNEFTDAADTGAPVAITRTPNTRRTSAGIIRMTFPQLRAGHPPYRI